MTNRRLGYSLSCSAGWTVSFGLAVVLAGATAYAHLVNGTAADEPGGDRVSLLAPAVVLTPATQSRIDTEIITLRPSGFEPASITRQEGRFLLALENRSGLEEIELRFERVGREHRVRIPRNKIDWRGLVNLRPGEYMLREVNHPNWTCRITVTERQR